MQTLFRIYRKQLSRAKCGLFKPRLPTIWNSSSAWTSCAERVTRNAEATPTRALIGRVWFLTLPSVRAWPKWKLSDALALGLCLDRAARALWAPNGSSMKSEDVTSSRDMQSVKPGAAVLPFSVEALMADRTPSRADKTTGSRALWCEDGSSFSSFSSAVREGDASLEAKSPERADRSSWTENSRLTPPPPPLPPSSKW